MRNFVVIYFCVLATLAISTDGAAIIDAPFGRSTVGASTGEHPSALVSVTPEDDAASLAGNSRDPTSESLEEYELPKLNLEFNSHIIKNSQQEIKSDTGKLCCYIGDVEILLPIVIKGAGPLRSKAIHAIMDSAERCKVERDNIVDSNAESSALPPSPAKANYKIGKLVKEILENDSAENVETNSGNGIEFDPSVKYNCDLNDFTPLFTTLANGTRDEKAVVFDALTRSIKYCDAERRTSGRALYRYCDMANEEKWGLFFQWMLGQYKNRMILAMERASEEGMRKLQHSRQHKSLIGKRLYIS